MLYPSIVVADDFSLGALIASTGLMNSQASFNFWFVILPKMAIWLSTLSLTILFTLFFFRRQNIPHRRCWILFNCFVFVLGTLELTDVLFLWFPNPTADILITIMGAVISWVTLLSLTPIIPKILYLRMPSQLIITLEEDKQAIEAAKEKAEAAEERYRLVVQGSNDGVWDWDIHKGEMFCNDRLFQMLGLNRTSFSLTYEHCVALIHPEDRPDLIQLIKAHLAEPQVPFNTEFRIRHVSGEYHYFMVKGTVQRDAYGQPVRVAGVAMDITVRKHLEIQLAQAKEAAEVANQNKSQFLANMSHELRTPLNAIIGYSEMLEAGMGGGNFLTEKQSKYIRNVIVSGHHLLEMVNDILDLSRVEAGKLTLSTEWLELDPFLYELENTVKKLAMEKKVSMTFRIQSTLSALEADPLRLKQIMLNLIINAIKFNREGGRVEVRMTKSDDWQWVICEVHDTGIGIPQNKMEELFSEFYQVDPSFSRQCEGTGLGLALTKQLVELHGGSISVASEEGVGSVFTFQIPNHVSPNFGLDANDDKPTALAGFKMPSIRQFPSH